MGTVAPATQLRANCPTVVARAQHRETIAISLARAHCSAIPISCAFRRRSSSNVAAFLKILLRSRHHWTWLTNALHRVVRSTDRLAQPQMTGN